MLTLVLDEGEAVGPLLEFLLVGELQLDLLKGHILGKLLDLELELDLKDLVLFFPLSTSFTISHDNYLPNSIRGK